MQSNLRKEFDEKRKVKREDRIFSLFLLGVVGLGVFGIGGNVISYLVEVWR